MSKHTYMQKYQTTFMQGEPITALLMNGDTLWVGTPKGLYYIVQEEVHPSDLDAPVTVIERSQSGPLWVGTEAGLYQQMGDGWNPVADVPIRAICPGNGGDIWYTDGQMVLGRRNVEPRMRDPRYALPGP